MIRALVMVILAACGPSSPSAEPCLGSPCERNADCDASLRCLHHVCVKSCEDVDDCPGEVDRCANIDDERFCADDDGLPFDSCSEMETR